MIARELDREGRSQAEADIAQYIGRAGKTCRSLRQPAGVRPIGIAWLPPAQETSSVWNEYFHACNRKPLGKQLPTLLARTLASTDANARTVASKMSAWSLGL